MRTKKIYFFIGTTAELIKLAPVIKEIKKRKISYKVISSGQGKLLLEDLPKEVRDIQIDLGFDGKINHSSVFHFSLWSIRTFFLNIFSLRQEFKGLDKNNSYFIVHGDTISSLLGSFIAHCYGLHLVHIESGLRSFHFFEPFPEEISRYIISHLADIHFCPNQWSIDNLKWVKGVKINTQENTLIETFWVAMNEKIQTKTLKKMVQGKYFVLVLHRQEHVIFRKKWSKDIIDFLLSQGNKDISCILIAHETTIKFLRSANFDEAFLKKHNVVLFPRLSYAAFINLTDKAEFIITDGGSNQEEMYYAGKPCLLLRSRTERIEGLTENIVLSKGNKIVISDFLHDYKNYTRKPIYPKKNPSKVIVDYLVKD